MSKIGLQPKGPIRPNSTQFSEPAAMVECQKCSVKHICEPYHYVSATGPPILHQSTVHINHRPVEKQEGMYVGRWGRGVSRLKRQMGLDGWVERGREEEFSESKDSMKGISHLHDGFFPTLA